MIKLIVSGRVGQDAELKSVGDTTVCSHFLLLIPKKCMALIHLKKQCG
jgi:hypothetical protein